jgi:hypothetical protein
MRKYKWKLKNIIMIIKYIWACFSVSLSFYKYWNWNTIAEKNPEGNYTQLQWYSKVILQLLDIHVNVILQEKEEIIIIMSGERHNQQYSNGSDFWSTWVHPRFVVGFVLLDL